ncbi:hypothetical protein [Rhodococcus sp. NCIMB 12038]|uniref:hypothetical protein n=1 Tax=Rhodococcus sp. NCIMB 12038 TaxID=933800 RepID=UPI000B3C4026|nr:hypothetical protein [Rhodococcus sp. NCIMB 12038]OUS97298.1 hypothetical protein CA951_02830 [Rhodococcus sp. NCIMB 12038]
MSETLSDKDAAAAVFAYLGSIEPQGRGRTHKTETPGHLDFSTDKVRGRIVRSDSHLTKEQLHPIVRTHTDDNRSGKAVMVFSTADVSIRRRDLPWWPVFHIASDRTITPMNKRAVVVHRRTPEMVAQRRSPRLGGRAERLVHPGRRILKGMGASRILGWTLSALLVVLLMIAALTALGATSGAIRTTGIIVLVVLGVAAVCIVLSIAEHVGLFRDK